MLTTAAHLAAKHDTANGTLSAIHEARHEVLMRLAIAAEYRDEATEQHMIRLGYMAEKLSA